MKASLHSEESFATLDGTGIRYAVFLQGCPFNCIYCHNPDTRPFSGGTPVEADELVAKIRRYKTYFKGGGGVTFSGGEPLVYPEFILECERKLAAFGIGCALDTSGAVELSESVRAAVDASELVILDIKMPDEERYEKFIGGGIERPLKLLDHCLKIKKRLWLRTVIVPGINDEEKIVDEYVALLGERLNGVEKYELLAFHTLGFSKYEKMGIVNPLADTPALGSERLGELQKYLDEKIERITGRKNG